MGQGPRPVQVDGVRFLHGIYVRVGHKLHAAALAIGGDVGVYMSAEGNQRYLHFFEQGQSSEEGANVSVFEAAYQSDPNVIHPTQLTVQCVQVRQCLGRVVVQAPSVYDREGVGCFGPLHHTGITASEDHQVDVEACQHVDDVVHVVWRPDRKELGGVLGVVRLSSQESDGAFERRSRQEARLVKEAIERLPF